MLAGIGVGVYRDVDDAIRRCVRLTDPVEPDGGAVARYAEAMGRYLALAGSPVVRGDGPDGGQ
jgi:hypothetical protein